MEILEIHSSRSVTLNTGNFSNTKLDFGATAFVDEGEDPEAAMTKLQSFVREGLIQDALPILSNMSHYNARYVLMQQFGMSESDAAAVFAAAEPPTPEEGFYLVDNDDEDGFSTGVTSDVLDDEDEDDALEFDADELAAAAESSDAHSIEPMSESGE